MAVRIVSHAEPIPGYRLIERIGGGGFGEVWKAEAPGGIHKAIKFVFGDLKGVGDDGHRAEQELKALSRVKTVRHPYILTLERYDIIDGQLIIVMELADRNLWDRFKECRSQGFPGIPRDELIGYMEEAAKALDLMNSEYQLQHLDIKPQNIFLVFNHIKVADFGLVKDLEGDQASVTGGVTPVYAAPETFDGYISRFCDQYSLAIVYQELLTGQRPFGGNNIRQLIAQHISAAPNLAPLPIADRAAIGRSLSKTPDARYPTCKELVAQLKKNTFLGTDGSTQAALPIAPSACIEAGPEPATNGPPTPTIRTKPTAESSTPSTTQFLRAVHAAGLTPETARSRKSPRNVEGDGTLFPSLVIGVGQMGMLVLQKLKDDLQQQFGDAERLGQLRLLLLNVDPEVMRTALRGGAGSALSAAEVMLTPLSRPSHYVKPREGRLPLDSWLNTRLLYRIPRSQVTAGVRTLGRLALFDHIKAIRRRLQTNLEETLDRSILEQTAEQTGLGVRTNRPRVYLVSALGGGTGSGMFLDLAYNLRRLLFEKGYERPDIVGVLLAPPIDRNRVGNLAVGNSYAALTELVHFANPTARFTAAYGEREPALEDIEAPFSRTIVLSLPDETDDSATREFIEFLGQFLSRDLTTPLGRTVDLARAGLEGPPWQSRGLYYQTFGLFTLSWPRKSLLKNAARILCQRILERWMNKDSKPVRELVEQWVREQWAAKQLGADQFISRLREECQRALGKEPESAFAAILEPLTERVAAHAAKAAKRRRSTPPLDLAVEEIESFLKRIEALVGNGLEEGQSEQSALLRTVMHETSERLIEEWSQALAEISVQLIEEPVYRLAGAEEAVRQTITTLEQALHSQENLGRELAGRASEAYDRLHKWRENPKTVRLLAADILELLGCFAKCRFQSLVLQQTTASFVSLRGHLSDAQREINFCRVRLKEMHRQFKENRPAESDLAAGICKKLLPLGCKDLNTAVDQFLASLGPNCLADLDGRLQEMIKSKFTALVEICLNNGTNLKNVETALVAETVSFAAGRLPRTDAAQMFLEQFPEEAAALEEIGGYFDAAYPKMTPSTGSAKPESLCVLAAPPGTAGDAFRALAAKSRSDLEIQHAVSDGDIVFYRELSFMPLTELEQLGPVGQETYRHMAATEHFTPHNRIDIDFSRK